MGLSVVVAVVSVALLAADVGKGEESGVVESPGITDHGKGKSDDEVRARERACDCCRQCLAAQRKVRGKEEGPPPLDGCRDCCSRCGGDFPLLHELPPEIVK